MARAEAIAWFRDEQQRLYPKSRHAQYYQLAADALEAVERLEAEREKLAQLVIMMRDHPLPDSLRDAFEQYGAEEELRNLAAEWRKRGRERRMLAQELDARADEIKARREG